MQGITYSASMKNTIKVEGKEYEPKLDKNGEIVFKEVGVIEPEVPEVAEYTTFTVVRKGTLNIANTYENSIKELYINDIQQSVPIGRIYNETTTYHVNTEDVIRIKGNFILYNSILSLKNIILQYDLIDCSYMFYSFRGTLDLSNFNTSNVQKMRYMFYEYEKNNLDLSNFNTSSVTDMAYMFGNCDGLTELDLTSFNTSNVTNMYGMFSNCNNLTKLDLTSFNTSNVTNMYGMFSYCNNLTKLDLTSFNTSSVTDMAYMFNNCDSITELDLTSFNTSSVTDMTNMFNNCDSITELDLSSFSVPMNTRVTNMFFNVPYIAEIKIDSCKFLINELGTSFTGVFTDVCTHEKPGKYTTFTIGETGTLNVSMAEEIYINNEQQNPPTGNSSYNVSNYSVNVGDKIKIKGRFSLYNTKLKINDIILQNNLTRCDEMFYNCSGLITAPEIPPYVTNCVYMFGGCYNLVKATEIPSSVVSCDSMFLNCYNLVECPTIIPSSVIHCSSMFNGCSNLMAAPEIEYGVEDCDYMFAYTGLTETPIIPSSVYNCSYMFYGCSSLTTIQELPYSIYNCSYMFSGCSSLTEIQYMPADISDCSYMFERCDNLTEAPIIPQNANDCSYMFYGCYNLTNITYENSDLMNWFSGNHEGCFRDCTRIYNPIYYWDIPDDWK